MTIDVILVEAFGSDNDWRGWTKMTESNDYWRVLCTDMTVSIIHYWPAIMCIIIIIEWRRIFILVMKLLASSLIVCVVCDYCINGYYYGWCLKWRRPRPKCQLIIEDDWPASVAPVFY